MNVIWLEVLTSLNAFTEVKTALDRRNHHKVNLDLYRLAVFSEEAIKLSGTLVIQAVGKFQ